LLKWWAELQFGEEGPGTEAKKKPKLSRREVQGKTPRTQNKTGGFSGFKVVRPDPGTTKTPNYVRKRGKAGPRGLRKKKGGSFGGTGEN